MVKWTGGALPTFVTHLECSLTGERYPADILQTLSKAGRPLLVRYDLDGVRRALPREMLAGRPQTFWRYRELLPVRRPDDVVSLGEVVTPLIPLPRIAARLGGGAILVKDDGRPPTGSFKARGLELAEQLGWELPDVIFYPTGGGTGIIGMWKAFAELEAIGWIGPKRPRMVVVQATGCAPMVKAWEEGAEHALRWENAHTFAAGIRVPQAIGDFLILRAVRESGGFAIAVTDDAIRSAWREVAAEEGLLLCPETAATYAAYQRALADGRVRPDERVVLFNCSSGLKYPMPEAGHRLKLGVSVNWQQFAGA